jgi:hypothetical protein
MRSRRTSAPKKCNGEADGLSTRIACPITPPLTAWCGGLIVDQAAAQDNHILKVFDLYGFGVWHAHVSLYADTSAVRMQRIDHGHRRQAQ